MSEDNIVYMKEYRKPKEELRNFVRIYSHGRNVNLEPGVLIGQEGPEKKTTAMWLNVDDLEDLIHVLMEAYSTILEKDEPNLH